MNTLNSLSSQSVNRINILIDKINATCDALISALEINSEKFLATIWLLWIGWMLTQNLLIWL